MKKDARVYVAGSQTVIGSAILRELDRQGCRNVVGREGEEPNLLDASAVEAFFARTGPEYVFVAAGRSGGIRVNQKNPADLMLDNLLTECHLIHSAHRHGARKLLYLGSSCCYPKLCPQPMGVDSLMSGPLEPTSEAYALAKIAGIKLCQAYRAQHGALFVSAIPADVFGPGDDFSAEDSHVVAALIRKLHEAKLAGAESVEVWGTGRPRRELLYSEDLAEACLLVMREYDGAEPINIGSGSNLSILELAELIQDVVGYRGSLRFDPSRPDGMPFKALDSSVLRGMGWRPRTAVREALAATYEAFRAIG